MDSGPEKVSEALSRLERIEAALTRLEGATGLLCDALNELRNRQTAKEWYTIEEFAALVDRAPFSTREWARLGRIRAEKRTSGRGKHQQWVISHDELLRYQRHGLLPIGNGRG